MRLNVKLALIELLMEKKKKTFQVKEIMAYGGIFVCVSLYVCDRRLVINLVEREFCTRK